MVQSTAQPTTQRSEDAQYWDVSASLDVTYKVICANGVLLSSNPLLLQLGSSEKNWRGDRGGRRIVFVENEVFRFYSGAINRFFCGEGSQIVVLNATEKSKNLQLVERTVEQMVQFGVNRRSEPVIAIGGGCLMDAVGFAASIYRRHVPYVRVPTTLLGIVDAGIGIKTGVNFGLHKNRIGSYCAPVATVLDTTFLATLPNRHIRNGLAEVLKMAIVSDATLFQLLESHASDLVEACAKSSPVSLKIIKRSIQRMLDALEPNLWEHDLYRTVDFGHTFSPVIEMLKVDCLLHGEAVAIDMCISTIIAARRHLIDIAAADRIIALTKRMGLPVINSDCTAANMQTALDDVVKHRDGLQRIPVPTAIGEATFLNDVCLQEVMEACEYLQRPFDEGVLGLSSF
ncbi:MAG: 3-dehydroquinate synthase (EC [uncultured Paraburkholderia sp.]|nr:MAG: 3-dehydroquinate synthase (EC [uncultured Paraburkholderia sp.]